MLNTEIIFKILSSNGVKLNKENVVIEMEEGFIFVELEDGELKVQIQHCDRIIKSDLTLSELLT